MNLISGKLMNKEQSDLQLGNLDELIIRTQQTSDLSADIVISACEKLAGTLNDDEYIPLLLELGIPQYKAKSELDTVRQMLSGKYIEKRLEIELGINKDNEYTPYGYENKVRHIIKPIGVLFHIVAGNVDALPVFSVIEGLLTGNINILKLPGSDNGLSVTFLKKLIDIEPQLTEYIYVFDYPSDDIESMKIMSNLSDAIVIWGGDSAVSSIRQLAETNTKIIEWGHKISFAYVSGSNISDDALEGIAHNICDTNQLFCSSCQGIYLDTSNYSDVVNFSERFIKILDRKAKSMTSNIDEFLIAQKTLESYTEQLESVKIEKHVLKTENCGVIAYNDSKLTLSYMFRNCWIKPLPRKNILYELKKHKNHLQTVALICHDDTKDYFTSLFSKTGIVRITSGKNMSSSYCGMPHDGEYSLQRYVKIFSCE